jgi:hypothetical protein
LAGTAPFFAGAAAAPLATILRLDMSKRKVGKTSPHEFLVVQSTERRGREGVTVIEEK